MTGMKETGQSNTAFCRPSVGITWLLKGGMLLLSRLSVGGLFYSHFWRELLYYHYCGGEMISWKGQFTAPSKNLTFILFFLQKTVKKI